MPQLLRARFIAPTLHAILFAATTYYVVLRNLPMLDPPALLPVAVLFFADFPMSVIAAGVIFTSSYGRLAWGLWGAVGTLWWYYLGRSIEARTHRFSRTSEK